MTSASTPMITRCPKCGTAFRVTQSQLQSAKGAVRCGSCLNVFKAQEYLVAVKPKATEAGASDSASNPSPEPSLPNITTASTPKPASIQQTSAPAPSIDRPAPTVSELKKPNLSIPLVSSAAMAAGKNTPPNKPLIDDSDDILISDDMDEQALASDDKYEFDGFMDIEVKPAADVSLFERKIRPENEDTLDKDTDESWAEMLIEEEEDEPQLGIARPKSDEELADEALDISRSVALEPQPEEPAPATQPPATKGLVFSLVEEPHPTQTQPDDFALSDELANLPSHQGFKPATEFEDLDRETEEEPAMAQALAAEVNEENNKRQVKTQPKIRAYDGSRTALLMNIMPAPIEFTAKRMRRWYQRKLWAALSLLGLIALVAQIAWFKFETLSRIEPYRTAYLFACPYLGCELPALVDIRQISTSNLVVRQHPDTENALAVDVMLVNSAPFEQPFPVLTLVFTDMDNNLVARRRFSPQDYLGGELAGVDLMPSNQKIYITLDLVDPGAEAVNYRIYIAE